MKDIFPKAELIALMKTQKFQCADSQAITDLHTTKSGNPFDKWDVGSIMFDNRLMIEIDKVDGRFVIKIGENTGWVAGMSMHSIEYTFDLTVLNLEEFTKAFKEMEAKRLFCLCNEYGSGNIDTILIRGTMEEIHAYATQHGYEMKKNEYNDKPYYVKLSMPHHQRCLNVYVLSSQIYDNIMRRV